MSNLDEALDEYRTALKNYDQVAGSVAGVIDQVAAKVSQEKRAGAARIKALEKKIDPSSPRAELAEINRRLAASEARKAKNDAEYWVSFYRGGAADILHDTERKKLEKRQKQLMEQLIYDPPGPEETELFRLREKKYGPDREGMKELEAAESRLTEAHNMTKQKRRELAAELDVMQKALDKAKAEISVNSYGQIDAGYSQLCDALKRAKVAK